MLWDDAGRFDRTALERGLAAAAVLRAPVLKMSIGGFGPASRASLAQLHDMLTDEKTGLLIENDQTARAGSVPALRDFFDFSDEAGLALGMTFDMGNLTWGGECPLQGSEERRGGTRGVSTCIERWAEDNK